MKGALIFDMDGTLIDSEPNYLRSDLELVCRFGGTMTKEEHDGYVGMGSLRFLELIKEKWNIAATLEEMLEVKDQLYMDLARKNTRVFPEMRRLLDRAAQEGIPLALASGSSQPVIDELTAQTGIQGYFQVLLSAEAVPRGKPAPDVFLEAARLLGVSPAECTVLEDSQYGVQAAKAAGMRCAAMPAPPASGDLAPSFYEADYLVDQGMDAFRADDFIQWWQSQRVEACCVPR